MGLQSIIVKDETIGREVKNEFLLEFLASEVTVADIIKERVRYEVEAYNRKTDGLFSGLIQPTDAEKKLNGFELKKRRKINLDKQVKTALRAFESNGYFMLIDDYQAEALSAKVTLKPDMIVTFVKLTPLVGG